MALFRDAMEVVGFAVDGVGVLVIIAGALLATARFLFRRAAFSYALYRRDLGRSILLGLEFLIAGDIIRTVVVAPTLGNVLVLAIIVLIRIFLSIALTMEIEGRCPWQRGCGIAPPPPEGADPAGEG